MGYNIIEDRIPGLPEPKYRNGKPEGVVLHETGAWGGTAKGNRNYEADHWKTAFVHYFVDWKDIVNVANPNFGAYGAGHVANQRFLHVELVRTKDKNEFEESYKRYVYLIAKLLHDYGLQPTRRGSLWTHHDVTKYLGGTTHQDPDEYLAYHNKTVDELISDIQKAYHEGEVVVTHEGGYKVVKGDTLYGIAKKAGISVADLKEINSLNSDIIHPGQILVVEKVEKPQPKPTPKPEPVKKSEPIIESYIGKRVESIYDGELNFYSKPSWDAKYRVGTIGKGIGFPDVIAKVKVEDGEQYKVKNSKGDIYYITASSKYVKLVGQSEPVQKPQPKPVEVKAVVPYPGKPIKKGDKGKDVERVQRAVGVKADGDFGPNTEKAVKDYQSRHGLSADGIVGPKTWSVMF